MAVREALNIALTQPLWAALAIGILILAIVSQAIHGARFAMRAALFFGGMAGFGLIQGWPTALSNPQAQSIELFRGYAWIADAALAGLFLVIGLILTLGRGRGGWFALILSLLLLTGGVGIRLGWWPDPVVSWPVFLPLPSLQEPGTMPLAIGILSVLAALGALVLQRQPAPPSPYGGPGPTTTDPAPLPAWMTRNDHDEEMDGDDEEEDHQDPPEGSPPGEGPPAPELGHPWTPLRKRSIRRHRARRVPRSGH